MIIEYSYITYLVLSIAMTVWVARTLSHNGLSFLMRSFDGDEGLAKSVNHMLVVGFYLINLGYILLALQSNAELRTARDAIEFLSWKVGLVMLVLGALHFFNVLVIAKWGNQTVRNSEGGIG